MMANKRQDDKNGNSRRSARAAEPEQLESAAEVSSATAAEVEEVAEKGGAKARGGRSPKKSGRSGPKEATSSSTPLEETAQGQPAEPAPANEPEEEAPKDPNDPKEFAQRFLMENGYITKPTKRDEDEDAEEVVHPLPAAATRGTPQGMLKQGREWLTTLAGGMNFDVEVTSSYDKGSKTLNFEISGADAAELLGPSESSPRVLEGMEKVLQQFLDIGRNDEYDLHIDVDGFRRRRSERLKKLADRLASLSRDIDKSITIAGMNEFERRVVHRHLNHDNDIKTDSFGYGAFRKIRLQPR